MALNPIACTENVVRSFLRYQLTAYPFADSHLHSQMRNLPNVGDAQPRRIGLSCELVSALQEADPA